MDRNDPPMLLPDNAQSDNNRYSLVLAEQTLPTKSNELTDLARAEIGTDFILDTEMPKANRLQRLFCVLMLLLTLFLVYFHFPRPQTPVKLKNEISFGNMKFPREKKFQLLLEKAQEVRKVGRYHECVKILTPAVTELQKSGLQQKEVLENQLLFALYLDAVRHIRKMPIPSLQKEIDALQQSGLKLVREIERHDPDTIQWHLLEIDLCLDQQLLNWNTGRASYNPEMVKHIDQVLKMLASTAERIKRSKLDDKKENLAMIDLRRVQLLIQKWKYSTKDLSDDDKGDPGVEEREKAYEIAERYDNVLDFLVLRKYIVDMIYENNSGYYWWRGKEYWRKKYLEDERRVLNKKINNAKATKGKIK